MTEDTYHIFARSGITVFETDDGLVLVDTGIYSESAAMAEKLRDFSQEPIETVILTHGHMDHVYGLDAYLLDGQDEPTIIAHENMADRFDRYERTIGYNEAINARQYGGTASVYGRLENLEDSLFGWPDHPPTTWYKDGLTINVGGLTLEIHHGKGETDDHTWVYCPERDVLCSGDLFANVPPNAGNPQKVQRYPEGWATALREMATKEPRVLCMGHFAPIVDQPEEVSHRMRTIANFLDTLVERTLNELNNGAPPHTDIVHRVSIPEVDEPWFEEKYHDTEFIIRNIVRYYGGWWSGRPSELKPASRSELATEVVALAGGTENLLTRIQQKLDQGEIKLACHLADYALEAAPDDKSVQSLTATVYSERAEQEKDGVSKNIFTAASEYAEDGRPFCSR